MCSTYDTITLRNVFTTVAVSLNFLITIIGSLYLKRSAQRILLQKKNGKNETVPVKDLVSWLPLGTVASYIWRVRKFPGGIVGTLMIWTGIFSLAHQYFTNSFIASQSILGNCPFESGVVTTYNKGATQVPASDWPPARIVYEAYLAVQRNGGVSGIYDKIDQNTTHFWPQRSDLLGYWNCTQGTDDVIDSGSWDNFDTIDTWIGNNNFMYPDWLDSGASYNDGSGLSGFIAWSASDFGSTEEEETQKMWDVRAIIATQHEVGQNTTASMFHCDMINSQPSWVPPVMPSRYTLGNWTDMAYGILGDAERTDFGNQLQWILNGMTMIAGSGNNAERPLPSGSYFSCVMGISKIGIEIFVLLGSLLLVLVCLVAMDLYSLLRYWRDPQHARVRDIPLDYISWQLATVRSADENTNLSEKDLGRFAFQWMEDKDALDFQEVTPGVGFLSLAASFFCRIFAKK